MSLTTTPNYRLIAGTTIITFTVLMNVTFPNLGGTGLQIPSNVTVWMSFGSIIALAMWPAVNGRIRYSRFHLGLILLLLALWLPFLWSWNAASLIALPRMLGVTMGGLLLLALAQRELDRPAWWYLGLAIFLGSLIQALLGYLQLYALGPKNWLDFDPDGHRPFGIFRQPNLMASFIATGLVISGWLLADSQQRFYRALLLLGPVLFPAIIIATQSRTGWLATLIAVPMIGLHLWRKSRFTGLIFGGGLLIGGLLAVLVVIMQPPDSHQNLETISSPGARLPVYLHSWQMITEAPVSGWGYGRFEHDFLHSFADWRASLPINQPDISVPAIGHKTFSHPHNELLFWGVEGGLLPMLALLFFSLWVASRILTQAPWQERWALFALLLPLTLHSMTEFPFYQSVAHWLAYLILLGYVNDRCWPHKTTRHRYTFSIRIGAFLATPLLWLFMTSQLQALWMVKDLFFSEGDRSVDMSEVINPLGTPNFLLQINQQLKLADALENDKSGLIAYYAAELEEEIQTRPDRTKLIWLESAYEALDRPADRERISALKHHLFPVKAES